MSDNQQTLPEKPIKNERNRRLAEAAAYSTWCAYAISTVVIITSLAFYAGRSGNEGGKEVSTVVSWLTFFNLPAAALVFVTPALHWWFVAPNLGTYNTNIIEKGRPELRSAVLAWLILELVNWGALLAGFIWRCIRLQSQFDYGGTTTTAVSSGYSLLMVFVTGVELLASTIGVFLLIWLFHRVRTAMNAATA